MGEGLFFLLDHSLAQACSGSQPPAPASRNGWRVLEKMALKRQSLIARSVWSTPASFWT